MAQRSPPTASRYALGMRTARRRRSEAECRSVRHLAECRTVPFMTGNETVRLGGLSIPAASGRESETMPSTENGTVRIGSERPTPERPALRVVGERALPPRRQRNSERRPEYLTPAEVEMLIATARKRGRYGHRDATMILIAYRHGLRIGELVALRWIRWISAKGSCMSPG
jgi:hypothetical protein